MSGPIKAALDQIRTILTLAGVRVDAGAVLQIMIARKTWDATHDRVKLEPMWEAVDAVRREIGTIPRT